ncbi:MAG TPA: class I SAM-dependent methyltransferase [Nostocaceae cyanobacterium]|nr:class I SAM-dependent methyltransferase [Nostocaceae cyanobacterium]
MKRVFTHISKVNLWESSESVSGMGSEISYTQVTREFIAQIVSELGIKSILDAPCGDFNWMKEVDLSGIHYTGVDIVSEIIEQNQQKYAQDHINFFTKDITKDPLPQADLIICRDCLVHLPFYYGYLALKQFQATGARYLLTTTYPETTKNQDVPVGSWRAINLCLPPFNFSEPMLLLKEISAGKGKSDKSLGLWKLEEMNFANMSDQMNWKIKLINWIRTSFNPSWQL